jgi:hypothetical protein
MTDVVTVMRWAVWVIVAVATVAGVVALVGLTALTVLLAVCRLRRTRDSSGRRSVTVLVLGDFGRSPRMQYHALSLGKMDKTAVDVVAYGGTECVEDIARDPDR